MKRRRFLQLSFFSGVSLVALGGTAGLLGRAFTDYPEVAVPTQEPARLHPAGDDVGEGDFTLSKREHAILTALALCILKGAEPDPARDGALAQRAFIARYLGYLDEALRSDVRSLLSLLEFYPVLTGGFSRFTKLTPDRQAAILRSWEVSSYALLRQGFAAVKSMCLLAHYQDARSFPSIGYDGPGTTYQQPARPPLPTK
jgi:hypothetical protein